MASTCSVAGCGNPAVADGLVPEYGDRPAEIHSVCADHLLEFQRMWLARAFVVAGEQQKAAVDAYQAVSDLLPRWQAGEASNDMMTATVEEAMRRCDALTEAGKVVAKFAETLTSPEAQQMAAEVQAHVETLESHLDSLVRLWQQR